MPVIYPIAVGLLFGTTLHTQLSEVWSLVVVFVLFGSIAGAQLCVLTQNQSLPTKYIGYFILAATLGFLWANVQASKILSQALPAAYFQKPVIIDGKVSDIFLNSQGPAKQTLRLASSRICIEPDDCQSYSGNINLSSSTTHRFSVNELVTLKVKLKAVKRHANPGSYDIEKKYFFDRVQAKGRIMAVLASEKKPSPILHSLRSRFFDNIAHASAQCDFKGILMALSLGEKRDISSSQWQVLQKTGTSHLVAISGLHIGLSAGFGFCIGGVLWRRVFYRTKISKQQFSAVFALLLAIFYAALSGFALPTKRACLMIGMLMFAIIVKVKIPIEHIFAASLMIILILNPLSPLSMGFWLSFIAVFALIVGCRQTADTRLARFFYPQWVIFIFMLPVLLWFFNQAPLLSPIANGIAIPLVSLTVVPLTLLGALMSLVSQSLAGFCFNLADSLLQYLWWILEWLINLLPQTMDFSLSPLQLGLLSIGCLLLILPRGFPYKKYGWCGFLPLFFTSPIQNDVEFTVLDAGQGLATVIQTKHHTVVFDAGPKEGKYFDAGKDVLLPFFRSKKIRKIDSLVISHGDLDHRGGFAALQANMDIQQIYTSEPDRVGAGDRCQSGLGWEYDGVYFTFLHPDKSYKKSNNNSCVLEIRCKERRILLTGDIEKSIEKRLIANQLIKPVDILLVPHHGSTSSSSDQFIRVAQPKYALYSVGFHNIYRFPKSTVQDSYRKFGSKQLRTDESGAISFTIRGDELSEPRLWAHESRRYWHK